MQVYLPVAELSANVMLLLALGGGVGFLSGLFGVGGGFLMTPLLILSGIPPAVAVGTGANQIIASAFSGVLAHMRRKTVDFKMGSILLIGGLAGSIIGVEVFRLLRQAGQVDLMVSISYVLFLGTVGGLMLVESINALRKVRSGRPVADKGRRSLAHTLPLRLRFPRSRLYISVIPPLGVGFFVGILTAIMGVGGGFIMVPAMIFLLGMPTSVVVGTSLFQIMIVSSFTTIMHAIQNQSVDVILALLLLVGGSIGAQFGVQAGARLRGEELRGILALLVLSVCAWMAFNLVVTPADPFSLSYREGS